MMVKKMTPIIMTMEMTMTMAKSMTQPAPLHGVLLKVFQQGAANTGNGKINFVFIHFIISRFYR